MFKTRKERTKEEMEKVEQAIDMALSVPPHQAIRMAYDDEEIAILNDEILYLIKEYERLVQESLR